MPSISVIVPVYKVEGFLHRCVDSILAQTYEDFELILVDDGSPDKCGAICDAYGERDNRVRVIHQKNGGLSAARNTGIDWAFANSDSQWLCFVDSDDWVHPDYLKRLHEAAEKTACQISACGLLRTSGEAFPENQKTDVFCMSADEYYCGDIHEGLTAVAWNKLYHRSLFEKLRYPIGKLHEDEFVTYLALYQAGRVGVTTMRLYAYYQNPEGIMRSQWHPGRMHVLEAFEQQIRFAQCRGNQRLLNMVSEKYVYSVYEHLCQAQPVYRKELRRKLRAALRLGRQCGAFPGNRQNLWAYESAYPVKPFWWIVSKFPEKGKEKSDE